MNNIKAKLEKELEFAVKMKNEYGEKIIFEVETRNANIAMHDFYHGMEEAFRDAIDIIEQESNK